MLCAIRITVSTPPSMAGALRGLNGGTHHFGNRMQEYAEYAAPAWGVAAQKLASVPVFVLVVFAVGKNDR
ncbi:MAG: hypothetical protein LBD20_01785 [Spirochaetaceae bacterium]|nr:hypothetical protein [Spirochaetaceae bacterium]